MRGPGYTLQIEKYSLCTQQSTDDQIHVCFSFLDPLLTLFHKFEVCYQKEIFLTLRDKFLIS